MADENTEVDDGVEGEGAKKKSKKGLFLGAGMLVLVAVGYLGATMGVTADEPIPQYEGPYVVPLSEERLQINLASTENTRVLLLEISAEFDAYSNGELEARLLEPRYQAYLIDALLKLGSSKSPEALASTDSKEAFLLEIRDAIDPICFPIHIGETTDPLETDSLSGLKPGDSAFNSNLRGRFYDHKLFVNGPAKTLRLDEGEEIAYLGTEVDLAVTNAEGHFIFVNVVNANPEFTGELNVGVKGRLRRILQKFFYVQ